LKTPKLQKIGCFGKISGVLRPESPIFVQNFEAMSRKKLIRFGENAESENVIQPGKEIFGKIKGNWSSFLKNSNPIVLEVGCGRAEYTTGLAQLFPEKNFVGVDLKGGRIWKGSSVSKEQNLKNTAFLRIMIQNLEEFFEENEADEIWITFPDPRPKEGDEKLRLTSPRYLEMYNKILKPGSYINLKTDNAGLYEYTLSLLQPDCELITTGKLKISDLEFTDDLYNSPLRPLAFDIQTTYEKRYLKEGIKIKYLRFKIY
jgi:tRNA (guanine-N7-)-methyltransferase